MIITSGKYKGQKIIAPDENITRPTLSKVRMGVFNTLQAMLDFDGKSFLDMYAGSGIMGLEAISRGFKNAVAIEKNPMVVNVLKNNYKKFDFSPELVVTDSIKYVMNTQKTFDVVYIDPPYYAGIYEKSINSIKFPCIIILEHVSDVCFENLNIIKQKKYGDKIITFLKK